MVIGHDPQVLLVKLEQILRLKVDRSDFGPVRDMGSLPYPQVFSLCRGQVYKHRKQQRTNANKRKQTQTNSNQ